ncbi:hypothetical protein [Microbacterium sp. CIAB417]|uniref:hypothetical protein n=1 Tax=Microbacterium sp. CIAB417 TaxID=2860287 RepID=UPI001FADDA92|nr:hypothetical protein [Microbacterium sp. CIAB417]
MTEPEEVIEPSRPHAREEQHQNHDDLVVIDPLRAPARGTAPGVRGRISGGVQAANRRRWEADVAAGLPGLLSAGASATEAVRRLRTAKKRLRELAAKEKLLAALEQGQPKPGRTSSLEAGS